MSYRPLPYGLEVQPSRIHGFGLFSSRHLREGTIIGVSHVKHGGFPDGYIRTQLGGFYNHSEEPNCVLSTTVLEQSKTIVKLLKTIKPIVPGDELTCRYTLYSVDSK